MLKSSNRNIVKQITVEKIKSKGGRVRPTTKKTKINKIFLIKFMSEQRAFNKQQLKFNTRIEKQVSVLRNDFNRMVKLNNLWHY